MNNPSHGREVRATPPRVEQAAQDLYERICDGVPSSEALEAVTREWLLTPHERESVIWLQAGGVS